MNVIDAVFMDITGPAPWTVHAECELRTRIDERRMAAAAHATVREHALLRARRAPAGRWLVSDDVPQPPLVVARAAGDDLADARGRLVSGGFELDGEPPVRFGVIRAPGGDRVIVAADHALVDGVGIGRVILSLLSHYTGGSSPRTDEHWRQAHALAVAAPPRDRIDATVRALRRAMVTPSVRLARERHDDVPGYGVAYHRLSAAAARALASAPQPGSTANDVVVAAFCLAGMAWNERHGAATLPFSVGVPLNLRPARSWLEGVCNAALPWPVHVDAEEPGEVLRQVTDQLRPVRSCLYSTEVRCLLAYLTARRGTALPVWLRLGLATTTVVSTVPGAATVGSAGGADQAIGGLYGGAPAPATMGMTFAVVPDARAYRLSARFLLSHQSTAGASRFLSLVESAIFGLVGATTRRAGSVPA